MAAKDKLLANVRPNGQEDAPQFRLDIDAQKATALGLTMADVNNTLSSPGVGRYIDDFIDRGRVKHVFVQADAPFRMRPEDFNSWYVRNAQGQWCRPPRLRPRTGNTARRGWSAYNGVSAMEINGEAAPGVSTGEAMKEIAEARQSSCPRLLRSTGPASPTRSVRAGAQTPMLYTLSLIVVFLCLAALYESWSIPTRDPARGAAGRYRRGAGELGARPRAMTSTSRWPCSRPSGSRARTRF